MSSKDGWRAYIPDPRYIDRQMARGVREDPIKSLAELIKNCDDSYDRLETAGHKVPRKIEINYLKFLQKSRSSIAGFIVRDWAEGMSKSTLEKTFGPKGYAADTSGGGRHGAIGVGAKDALRGMEQCFVISIKDKVVSIMELATIQKKNYKQVVNRPVVDDAAKNVLKEFNKLIRKGTKLNLDENGTIVMFKIPKKQSGLVHDNLKNRLTNFSTLRTIMEDNSINVSLTNLTSGKQERLTRTPITGNEITNQKLSIDYNSHKYEIDLVIKKSPKKLSKERDIGDNILVKTEFGGVLDNTMFRFKEFKSANPFFGDVIIHDWEYLYDSCNGEVLTDNREGLDYNHDFSEQLYDLVSDILEPYVDAEKRNYISSPAATKELQKRFNKAVNYINKLMNTKIIVIDEFVDKSQKVDGMKFVPSTIDIAAKGSRTVTLLINPKKIPPSSTILLSYDDDVVKTEPEKQVETKWTYEDEEKPQQIRLKINGLKEGKKTVLKALCKGIKAELFIHVENENLFKPENGMAFFPDKVSFRKGVNRNLNLFVDTEKIPPNTKITIKSENPLIEILKNIIEVPNPNVGEHIAEVKIPVSSTHSKISGFISANCTSLTDDVEAICEVNITEKPPPKVFFNGWDWWDEGEGHERTKFDTQTRKVLVTRNSPTLNTYFGDDLSRITGNPEPDAMAILADTVLQTILRVCAIELIANRTVNTWNESDEEAVERIKNNLEFEHGKVLHQSIVTMGPSN